MKKVAVLGTGPAGLMAAHAAGTFGAMVSIFSQGGDNVPTKSRIGGAQFLHQALPLVNDPEPDATIRYLVAGASDGYRQKVYGDADVPFVSMERLPADESTHAWSLTNTYDRLWDLYVSGGSVNVRHLDPHALIDIIERGSFDLIVNTIPRTALCLAHAGLVPEAHTFVSQSIKIKNDYCALPVPDNTMVYDGTNNVSWYRTSTIFGTSSTEWGESMRDKTMPYTDLVTAKKPIRTDCSCWDGKVLFTGRQGAWRKGVLTHHAYIDVWKALDS